MILQNFLAKFHINFQYQYTLNTFGVYVLSQKYSKQHILGDTVICIARMTVGSNIYNAWSIWSNI